MFCYKVLTYREASDFYKNHHIKIKFSPTTIKLQHTNHKALHTIKLGSGVPCH